jgi:HK97 family phage major capsid protein
MQTLANQVGAKRFEAAKNLLLQDLVIVDSDGKPVDPAQIDYQVTLSPRTSKEEEEEEQDMVKPEEEDGHKPDEEPSKALVDEAVKAIKAESVNQPTRIKDTPSMSITPTYARSKHFKTADEAYGFGRFILAARGHAKSKSWCIEQGIITKDHLEGNNTLGGFLVPEQYNETIISLRESFGVFRQNSNVLAMQRDVLQVPRRTANLTAFFVGEAASATESTQNFDLVSLVAKKAVVLTQISGELAEDNVVGLADQVAGEMAYAQAKLEDQCGFIGDGTSTYGGIVGLATAVGSAGVSTATSTALSSITLAQVRAAMGLLPQYADNANTKFYMHRTVFNSLCQRLAESAGGATVVELADGANKARFLGYPVVFSQTMNSSTGNGSVMFHFGDLRQASLFGDRKQNQIAFSDSALSGFESDLVTVRGISRFDINNANCGSSSAAGSIVTLKAGA